jgi:hypothetical protein
VRLGVVDTASRRDGDGLRVSVFSSGLLPDASDQIVGPSRSGTAASRLVSPASTMQLRFVFEPVGQPVGARIVVDEAVPS